MSAKKTTAKPPSRKPARKQPQRGASVTIQEALAWLKHNGKKKNIEGHLRYGIDATNPFGVTVGEVKKYSRQIGKDHKLALQLWKSDHYEARLLAAFVDEPEHVTTAQMNAWADDFDNWGIVDTVCFHLFDRAAGAWKVLPQWAKAKAEFKKRAAFALLWSLSVHDKDASNASFIKGLRLIEAAADDERNFVKKAVNMALRAIGKRNVALNTVAIETAKRLAASADATSRWIGKHALRELESAAVRKRLKD